MSKLSLEDFYFDEKADLIGRGGFAKVVRAKRRRDGIDVALKMIDKRETAKQRLDSKVREEIVIQQSLKHRHIVELIGRFEDERNYYLVLEFCPMGSLSQYLRRADHRMPEAEVSRIFRQVCEGVMYLHDQGVVHRDISIGNVLLDVNGEAKICDFGLATRVRKEKNDHFTVCGTPNFMSPEVASRQGHSFEADLWSLGCLLYNMLAFPRVLQPLFDRTSSSREQGDMDQKIVDLRDQVVEDTSLSAVAKDLILRFLQSRPDKRIKIREALKHDFLKPQAYGIHGMSLLSTDSGRGTFNSREMSYRPSIKGLPGNGVSSLHSSTRMRSRRTDPASAGSKFSADDLQFLPPKPQRPHSHYDSRPIDNGNRYGGSSSQTASSDHYSRGFNEPSCSHNSGVMESYRERKRSPSVEHQGREAGRSDSVRLQRCNSFVTTGRCNNSYQHSNPPLPNVEPDYEESCRHPSEIQRTRCRSFKETGNCSGACEKDSMDQRSRKISCSESRPIPDCTSFRATGVCGATCQKPSPGMENGWSTSSRPPSKVASSRDCAASVGRSTHEAADPEWIECEVRDEEGKTLNDVTPPLCSKRLQSTRQKTRNAVMSITDEGEVVVEFIKPKAKVDFVVEVFRISPDGLKLIYYLPNGGKGLPVAEIPPQFNVFSAQQFEYASLPVKFWKKYSYAAKFVNLLRSKQPKISLYVPGAKCIWMENGDFEVHLTPSGKVLIKLAGDEGFSLKLATATEAVLEEEFTNCRTWLHQCEVINSALESAESATNSSCFPVIIGGRKNLVPPATRHGRTSSLSKENRVTDEPSRIEARSIQQTTARKPLGEQNRPSHISPATNECFIKEFDCWVSKVEGRLCLKYRDSGEEVILPAADDSDYIIYIGQDKKAQRCKKGLNWPQELSRKMTNIPKILELLCRSGLDTT